MTLKRAYVFSRYIEMSNRASKMNHYNANLINQLVSGFGKVLSVIETNNTYYEILGEKIDSMLNFLKFLKFHVPKHLQGPKG